MTQDNINQLINTRKRIVVIRTYLIDISIINTHHSFLSRLFNDIGKPLRVLDLDNKFCC